MKKSISILSLCMMLSYGLIAQDYKFNVSEYDFDPKALNVQLMDSVGHHTCLSWKRVYEDLLQNGENIFKVKLVHTLRQINDDVAVETFNKQYLQLSSNSQIFNLKTRVIIDGKEVFSADAEDIKTIEEEGTQYQLLALDKVQKGCFIESIVAQSNTLDFTGTERIADNGPMDAFEYSIISPEVVHYNFKIYNGNLTVKDTVVDARRFMTVKAFKIPAITEEEYSHPKANLLRLEYALKNIDNSKSVGQKWSDIGLEYFQGVFNGFDRSENGVKKIIKELGLAKMQTNIEKIFAVEDFIKRSVNIESQAPYEVIASDMVKKKYGSQYSVNRLYEFIFQLAQIPYEIILTCEKDWKTFDKTFESPEFVQNVLFYFPSENVFLDPANVGLRLPIINNGFLGQDALRLRVMELGGQLNCVTTLTKIPMNELDKSIIEEDYSVTFVDDQSRNSIAYHKAYSGYADQGLRMLSFYTTDEKRKELLEGVVKGSSSVAEVSNVVAKNFNLTNREEYNKPFEMTATIVTGEMLEFAGDKLIFNVGEVIGRQNELYNAKPRVNPIDLEFVHEYRRKIEVILPTGFHFEGLDAINKSVECRNDAGKMLCFFKASYKVEGDKLIVSIVESYPETKIELKYYKDFAAVINAAADFNKISVLLQK